MGFKKVNMDKKYRSEGFLLDFFLHFSEESFLFILFFCYPFAGIPAVMFPDELPAP